MCGARLGSGHIGADGETETIEMVLFSPKMGVIIIASFVMLVQPSAQAQVPPADDAVQAQSPARRDARPEAQVPEIQTPAPGALPSQTRVEPQSPAVPVPTQVPVSTQATPPASVQPLEAVAPPSEPVPTPPAPVETIIPVPLPVPVPKTIDQAGAVLQDVATGDVKALRRGPLLIHGNYCGIGNRPGTAPVDPLDAACMRHDGCTKTGQLPSCACDNRLREEAMAISKDPRTPADIQALATTMATSMAILICK